MRQPSVLKPWRRAPSSARARYCAFGRVSLVAIVVAGTVALASTSAAAARRPQPRPLFRVRTPDRLVALSFDDGPDPRWTPTVLALLARYGARATFFDVGANAARAPGLVAAEVSAGNEVGNHTWNHPHLRSLGRHAVASQLLADGQLLATITGTAPVLFRPPFGEWNAQVLAAATAAGLKTVLWSACVERFVNHEPIAEGVEDIIGQLTPGAIVLAHDGGIPDRRRTLAALPLLLQGLEHDGYRIVTVSELLRHPAPQTQHIGPSHVSTQHDTDES
jgi:peptidoglycan/xylan/chitin deacetylase (PgdA/CDA1 family)